jgi:uncharacterized membrane protein YhaH (DUF805 family)
MITRGAPMLQELRALFSLEGRINRFRYWLLLLAALVFSALLEFVFSLFLVIFEPDFGGFITVADVTISTPYLAGVLVWLWVAVNVSVRRLHDHGMPGWWVVPLVLFPGVINEIRPALPFVPKPLKAPSLIIAAVLALFALVQLGCRRGMAGENRYGPDPLGDEESVASAFN